MVWQANVAAWDQTAMVSAVVVVRDDAHDGVPLLAFAATHPVRRRQGQARTLMSTAMNVLHAGGHRELHLAVTIGNPAVALYASLRLRRC